MRSKTYHNLMAKIKERNQVPPPSEDTARKMAIYEPGSEFLTRYQIYWCLHLKLTASKTGRNKCPLFINKQQNSKGSKKKTESFIKELSQGFQLIFSAEILQMEGSSMNIFKELKGKNLLSMVLYPARWLFRTE